MLNGSPGYAVIDVETTGLHPALHDRVIEIGIVHLDPAGHVTGEWSTLLNPGRTSAPSTSTASPPPTSATPPPSPTSPPP
ncbi:exonuclease domain-containing protein [Planomonospora algeriensis]